MRCECNVIIVSFFNIHPFIHWCVCVRQNERITGNQPLLLIFMRINLPAVITVPITTTTTTTKLTKGLRFSLYFLATCRRYTCSAEQNNRIGFLFSDELSDKYTARSLHGRYVNVNTIHSLACKTSARQGLLALTTCCHRHCICLA